MHELLNCCGFFWLIRQSTLTFGIFSRNQLAIVLLIKSTPVFLAGNVADNTVIVAVGVIVLCITAAIIAVMFYCFKADNRYMGLNVLRSFERFCFH